MALAIRATAGDNLEATIAGSIDEAFAGGAPGNKGLREATKKLEAAP